MPNAKELKAKASAILEDCPICSGLIKQVVLAEYPRPTSPEVVVWDVACGICDACGEKYFNAEQLKVLERKTNEELRKAKQYLTAEEIATFFESIALQTGLPESKIAEAFGVTRQELHRWKTSERIQSPTVESFIRFASEEPDRFAAFINSRVVPSAQRGRPKKAVG